MKNFLCLALGLLLLVLARCSKGPSDVAGGSVTDVGNAFVQGKIVTSDGTLAANVRVTLLPASFDPVRQSSAVILADTTDNLGVYSFPGVPAGAYNIEGLGLSDRTKSLKLLGVAAGDTLRLSADTLKATGTLKVVLHKPVDTLNGYFYIPGTSSFVQFIWNSPDSGYAILDSVPAGLIPLVMYSEASFGAPPVRVATDLPVAPGAFTAAEWGVSFDVVRTAVLPVIDGVLDEYAACVPILIMDSLDGTRADIRLLWDDSALYIGVRVADRRLYYFPGYTGEGGISQDDGIELMVNKAGGRNFWLGPDDYKFYVNVAKRKVDSRGGDSIWNSAWQAKMVPQGTPNDSSDTDTGYTVEIAVPWTDLSAGPAFTGEKVGFDIVLNNGWRHNEWNQLPWANHHVLPDYLWINIPEEWGELNLK